MVGGKSSGGGGGGTTNYSALTNKPQVNGNTLTGNKSGADLGLVNAEAGKGLSSNDFTAAEKEKLESLSNYDDTSLTEQIAANTTAINNRYTKAEVDAKIEESLDQFDKLDYQIVASLPTTGEAGVRYLVKHATDAQYEEYIYVSGAWHDIGSTANVDLSNYYTQAQTDTAITNAVNGKVFVAEYNVTTAQEIIAYMEAANEPFAPILIKRGGLYTVTTAEKQTDEKVIIRSFATLSGEFYMFTYTITNGVWAGGNYGFQKKLVSGTDIKTINGESVLGSGNITVQGGGGTVDQTYNATSTNAQSGTAVAEAVAGLATEGYVNNAVSGLATETFVNGALAGLASETYVNSAVNGLASETYVDNAVAPKMEMPAYELCNNDSGGNVVQVGSLTINGTTYGIYEFYYKTGLLPNANSKTYDLANLLADYTIGNFIDATGVSDNGTFIGSGRTDNENRLIVQQFSKNNKTFTIRTYSDFSSQGAYVKIKFYGTKNA